MVLDSSRRTCALCGLQFHAQAFLCRDCAEKYSRGSVPREVRQQFYEAVDRLYPAWSNTYGNYNPPEALINYLQRAPASLRILELGSGGGFTARHLIDNGFNDVVATDITPTSMEELHRRVGRDRSVCCDAESLPFADDAFDIVLSTDVIEHLDHFDEHLADVRRVLSPGGAYLIKTPNRRIAEAYYRARDMYDWRFWHPSMSTAWELRGRLAQHGFIARFLRPASLTEAQLRKLPVALQPAAKRAPLRWLPPSVRPHLELVARLSK